MYICGKSMLFVYYLVLWIVFMNGLLCVYKWCILLWSWPTLYHKPSEMSRPPRHSYNWHIAPWQYSFPQALSDKQWKHSEHQWSQCQWVYLPCGKVLQTCGKLSDNLWKNSFPQVNNDCEYVWMTVNNSWQMCSPVI